MTKSTITRERLEWLSQISCRDDIEDIGGDEIREMARMALAAMDSEPVVQPVMFIDGDISSDDADKLAKIIREFNEEDERPLAKMARIIRENPHPTNECDMPKAQPAPVVEREPIAWLNDAYLARGVVDGEAGSEDAGPGYIPVYREAGPQPATVTQQEQMFGIGSIFKPQRVSEQEADCDDCVHYQPQICHGEGCPAISEQSAPVAYSDFEEFWSAYIHPLAQDDELKGFAWDIWCAAMLQSAHAVRDLSTPVDPQVAEYEQSVLQTQSVCTCPSGDGSLRWPCPSHPGNSLVIPDGYVMVPKEPTEEMLAAAKEWTGLTSTAEAVYIKMLAAVPQLPGSEPAAVPGGWIPVSERMPEDRISVILWDAEIGEVTSGHYSHKTQTFYHCGDTIENEITHWMPPPCAPQEVK